MNEYYIMLFAVFDLPVNLSLVKRRLLSIQGKVSALRLVFPAHEGAEPAELPQLRGRCAGTRMTPCPAEVTLGPFEFTPMFM